MGMAASQARYLALTARQNNLQYQGQQVNQQRLQLSNLTAELYNETLTMEVPTPPSPQDYTTVVYEGIDGSTTFRVGSVKPSATYEGKYICELSSVRTGHSIETEVGKVKVAEQTLVKDVKTSTIMRNANVSSTYIVDTSNFNTFPPTGDDENGVYVVETDFATEAAFNEAVANGNVYVKDQNNHLQKATSATVYDSSTRYYVIQFGLRQNDSYTATDKYQKLSPQDISVAASQIQNIYVLDNNTWRQAKTTDFVDLGGGRYGFKTDVQYSNYDPTNGTNKTVTYTGATVQGKRVMDFAEGRLLRPDLDWDAYAQAVENTYGLNEDSLKPDDFYAYITLNEAGVDEVHFVLQSEVNLIINSQDDEQLQHNPYIQSYEYIPNGQFNVSENRDGCNLTFDPTTGRILTIDIPIGTVNGEEKYQTFNLAAITETNQVEYDKAFSEYEYEKYLYDKRVQEINAKTSIIQIEDRQLELRLKRLDTENNAIQTEIDAVKKVIQDNVEKSFKTFSG